MLITRAPVRHRPADRLRLGLDRDRPVRADDLRDQQLGGGASPAIPIAVVRLAPRSARRRTSRGPGCRRVAEPPTKLRAAAIRPRSSGCLPSTPESITATRTRASGGGSVQASNARFWADVPLAWQERVVRDEGRPAGRGAARRSGRRGPPRARAADGARHDERRDRREVDDRGSRPRRSSSLRDARRGPRPARSRPRTAPRPPSRGPARPSTDGRDGATAGRSRSLRRSRPRR